MYKIKVPIADKLEVIGCLPNTFFLPIFLLNGALQVLVPDLCWRMDK